MSNLAGFLMARVGEHRAIIRHVTDHNIGTRWVNVRGNVYENGPTKRRLLMLDTGNGTPSTVGDHTAAVDPAWLLGWCTTVEAMVNAWMRDDDQQPVWDTAMRMVAAQYAHHPGYRKSWAVHR